MVRPPSLQQQLLLRAARLFPRETALGPGPVAAAGTLMGAPGSHAIYTQPQPDKQWPQETEVPRVSVSSLPGTRPAWLHSCPKCPVLAPGRRVSHHRDSFTQQS